MNVKKLDAIAMGYYWLRVIVINKMGNIVLGNTFCPSGNSLLNEFAFLAGLTLIGI